MCPPEGKDGKAPEKNDAITQNLQEDIVYHYCSVNNKVHPENIYKMYQTGQS